MNLSELSRLVGERLRGRGLLLATAESCSGGWIAKCITDVPGSSGWFDRGFVTYSNAAKMEMLGVRAETLGRFGAVSEETVREMAAGALAYSCAGVAVAVSGIAGPSGGTPDKPVGTVWLAWQMKGQAPVARWYHFNGDREAVRRQAVATALQGILDVCRSE
ncbi:nicotinamide-nucleotide amidase [Methylomarinovum tepidoasis]|uniref:Nicotinamide-nucleotide amidase n=1 Tax=Methylomarinovum tepidoasis TaxID=2840183 RepID=A0AAU9C4Z6_9GAMM|nr:nicotinamide-nucleotide amidase [Methylomarinovum sp. IN45]BCX88219.1 nicotinamide-nucleotide amidase [Methylomarinovum sp. IN45]